MVQQVSPEEGDEKHQRKLKVAPLSGVDLSDAAARLKSRADSGDDNIFEILPRFAISGGESNEAWESQYVERRNEVLAVTGGDITGIAVGCDLIAFEKDKDEPSEQMHFKTPVNFMVWRRSILLLGLSSSEIVLVDPTNYRVKHTWKLRGDLEGSQRYFVEAFIHSTSNSTKIDVVIAAVDGSVYKIRNVSLSDGYLDATHDQNLSLEIDMGTIKDIQEFEYPVNSEVATVSSPSRNKIILIEKCGRITIADLKDGVDDALRSSPSIEFESNIFSCLSPQLVKSSVFPVKVVSQDGILFVLLSNGILEILSGNDAFSFEVLKLPVPTMTIYDFRLVMNNNEGTVKLWVLYGDTCASGGENYVGIFNGPDFETEFIFQLPALDRSGSRFKFPSNVSSFEEPTTIVEMASGEVRMHHVMETSTDVTLQKLLSRGKYAEAHDLALAYNKDLDIVKKAEARDKLNKIISYLTEGRTSSAEKEYFQLLDILKSITDAEFICQFCVQAQIHKVEWVKEVLGLGKGRVRECPNSAAARMLLLTVKKFYTFELVFPSGTICDWNAFVSKDNTMFIQAMKFLQSGNFDKCERVWTRHTEEFIPEITLRDFLPFFDVLFDHQLKSSESVSLLKTILPFSVDKVAASSMPSNHENQGHVTSWIELNVLISIILRQVSTLESKVDWPINALKFIKILISIVKDEMKRLEVSRTEQLSSLQKKKAIVKKLLANLDYIEQVLEELGELKKNHSIRMLFSDYTQNDISEVISKLLYKLLSKEEVEGFVSEYLRPYAARKNLDMDFLFFEHIKSVLQTIHYYMQVSNIPHEERITCLVHLISSPETKLQCVLQISEEWPVPWTSGIDSMVKQILNTFARNSLSRNCQLLYDSITTMRKQVPYRCVINKYKLNGSKLLLYSSYVTMALLRILKLKKVGYYDDCRELLKNTAGERGRVLEQFRLEYLEFTLRMYNETIDEEDVLPLDHKTRQSLAKTMMHRLELELEMMDADNDQDSSGSQEEVAERKRHTTLYKYTTLESQDSRKRILARLKQVMPTIPLDVIYREDFPFAILHQFLEEAEICSKSPSEIVEDCKELCKITQTYLPDMLLLVAGYFTEEGVTGNPFAYLWCIVENIVQSPINLDLRNSSANRELLQVASYTIVTKLLSQCPKLSMEQMDTLHGFLSLISNTFNGLGEIVARLLCFYRIFFSLKEQEIPLENEFLGIYKWLSGDQGIKWDSIKKKIIFIGETLMKFGEADLYFSVFKCIRCHLLSHTATMNMNSSCQQSIAGIRFYEGIIAEIENIKERLRTLPNILPEEDDRNLQVLVQDLNEAGVRVNLYALKLRNKVKLMERLLKAQNYILAADLAIAFELYDESSIWSRILWGCTLSKDTNELRRVLEIIRTVPQLWTLSEFSAAWKKVSAVDANFYHLCPIPLD